MPSLPDVATSFFPPASNNVTTVAAGFRDVDDIVPDDRRGADALADAPVGHLTQPQRCAGPGIERVEETVLRTANHPPRGDRDALVGRVHFRTSRDVLVRPHLS